MTSLWLDVAGRWLGLKLSFPGATTADCVEACSCGSSAVVGDGRTPAPGKRDEYVARGFCAACRTPRGTIHAKVSTIFGVEEDERVLAGPWRVY